MENDNFLILTITILCNHKEKRIASDANYDHRGKRQQNDTCT